MKNMIEIRVRLSIIKPLEDRVSALNRRLWDAEAEAAALLKKYEEESLDVQRIQKDSIWNFAQKVIGKFEAQVEKEIKEEIEAKINYDRVLSDISELKREKRDLGLRLAELHRLEREYETELENRRIYINQRLSETDGLQYKKYDEKIKAVAGQITEIKEAINAASHVSATAKSAVKSFESAEGWATYDIWARGGLISHMAKYSHIDDAEECFNRLSSQIRNLSAELSDVQDLPAPYLTQISGTQRTIDFWFDNIFTDISVRSQIRDNIAQLKDLLEKVSGIEAILESKSRDLNVKLSDIKRRQEDLLVSL
ncbi:MAG: hypothetical protein LBU32_18750 [Clostridiales bacterium]|nr:hypothetical protein [Clostridiales bacterium]